MKDKVVVSVSKITGTTLPDQSLCYGFTVIYEDGEILNVIRQAAPQNQSEILHTLMSLHAQYNNQIAQPDSIKESDS